MAQEDLSLFKDLEAEAFQRGAEAGFEAYRDALPVGLFLKCCMCKQVGQPETIYFEGDDILCEQCARVL